MNELNRCHVVEWASNLYFNFCLKISDHTVVDFADPGLDSSHIWKPTKAPFTCGNLAAWRGSATDGK